MLKQSSTIKSFFCPASFENQKKYLLMTSQFPIACMVMYLCSYSNSCHKTKGLECALHVKLLEYTFEMSVVASPLLRSKSARPANIVVAKC